MLQGEQVAVERPESVVIDTNLLVRYLANDDASKAKAFERLIDRAADGKLKIMVPSIVIAELVWVLESFYKIRPDEIVEPIMAILNTPGIEVSDRLIVTSALRLYSTSSMDFIDAWIIKFAEVHEIKTIYTFDRKHFKNGGGVVIKSLDT